AGCDPARHRTQPRSTSSRGADTAAAGALRLAQPSRTGSYGAGRLRPVEQGGRWRARYFRDHGAGAPRPGDAKDEGRLAGRPGEYGRETAPHASTERLIRPRNAETSSCLTCIQGSLLDVANSIRR